MKKKKKKQKKERGRHEDLEGNMGRERNSVQ